MANTLLAPHGALRAAAGNTPTDHKLSCQAACKATVPCTNCPPPTRPAQNWWPELTEYCGQPSFTVLHQTARHALTISQPAAGHYTHKNTAITPSLLLADPLSPPCCTSGTEATCQPQQHCHHYRYCKACVRTFQDRQVHHMCWMCNGSITAWPEAPGVLQGHIAPAHQPAATAIMVCGA